MAEFDWVTARAECSLVVTFEKLKLQLRDDVDKREAILRAGPEANYGFKLVLDRKGAAVVMEGNQIHDSVLFRLTDKAIEVVDNAGKTRFAATPTLDDEGQCKLSVNGQELELWQFRKKALEALFFNDPQKAPEPKWKMQQ